jgi:uncharacterized protein YcbX
LRGEALVREIAERSGLRLELMRLRNGIFDDAPVSVINLATIDGISRAVGMDLDRSRFRANIVLETGSPEPFLEDAWVGGTRCMMINLDPDTGEQDGRVMKAVVGLNANHAGVYWGGGASGHAQGRAVRESSSLSPFSPPRRRGTLASRLDLGKLDD